MNQLDNNSFVSVIVPVTGISPALRTNLISLIEQNYPFYDVIFVVRNKYDPAADVVNQLSKKYQQARRIYAGDTLTCSQKNHNLLAGVKEAGDKTDILVFCDSGHLAHPTWLATLLAPLFAKPSCMVASGYHQIFPQKYCLASLGRATCVLALNLVRQLPTLGQPWGGATAIRKELFEELSVAKTWQENVIDDVSLARILQDAKIPVAISTLADLETHLVDVSYRGWISWLTRQWIYLKFIYPGLWFITGLGAIFATILINVSIINCFFAIFLPVPAQVFQLSFFCFIFFSLCSMLLRLKHPKPGPLFLWLPSSLMGLTMGGWCHILTWLPNTIVWANIVYHVGKKGKVLKIIRHDSGDNSQ